MMGSASMNVKQPSINIIISGAKPSARYSRKSISDWPISKEHMGWASSYMYIYMCVYFRLTINKEHMGLGSIYMYMFMNMYMYVFSDWPIG